MEFNQKHSRDRFDGIHLDVEPQQRPENKGPGNLRFLPDLADAFRGVRGMAEPAGMTVNADIQNKLLKGNPGERRMLLSAVPRVTLMMYELSSPGDGESAEQKAEKAEKASEKFLDYGLRRIGRPESGEDGDRAAHARLWQPASANAEETRRLEPRQSPLSRMGATFLQ